MTSTIAFVYYLVCVGLLIAGLRLAEVRPLMEWVLLIGWSGLILVSVWFFGSYLPRLRGRQGAWRVRDSALTIRPW